MWDARPIAAGRSLLVELHVSHWPYIEFPIRANRGLAVVVVDQSKTDGKRLDSTPYSVSGRSVGHMVRSDSCDFRRSVIDGRAVGWCET